jgi:Cu/Ag efflux protein CusF
MMRSRMPLVLLGSAVLTLGACERQAERPAPSASGTSSTQDQAAGAAASTGATQTYHTRGIIKQLPDPKSPTAEFMIQHEAIDTFVNGQGKVVGMNAMTMPFPKLGEGISLDGFAINDKIAFSFTVTWPGPTWVVDSIEKLAPETEMVFGRAKPPETEPPSGGAE